MLRLEDVPEFIMRRVPITPMPTAARTTSVVARLALAIRMMRSENVRQVVAVRIVRLAELRLVAGWLGATSADRSAKRPDSAAAAQVRPRKFRGVGKRSMACARS